MKKIINILLASAALLTVLSGCQERTEGDVKVVDLRYRVNDSYDLPATNAQSFAIVVASSDPWYIYSEHPEWCIISQEQGAAVEDLEQLHIGKAPATTVYVQYYDNTDLDDREDRIIIQSDFWIGKKVIVRQKGSAFLTISDEDLDQKVIKEGGDYTIHINSNQDWSAQVTEGDKWLSINEGATGSKVGDITLTAADNLSEMRYASVTIFDRHDKPAYIAKFTQDGIQIEPLKSENRAFYNDESVTISLKSNTQWTVSKESEGDDWFTLVTTSGEGDGNIQITLTPNEGQSLRKANIILRNVTESEDDVQVEKVIILKQGYQVFPEHHVLDNDELAQWSSDQTNSPVYMKDVGTFFDYPCRVNTGRAIGNASIVKAEALTSAPNADIHVFRWSAITSGVAAGSDQPRVRQWFCFNTDPADKDAEMKVDIRPFDGDGGKISISFNAAGDGNKPSVSDITTKDVTLDWTQPIELWVKFEPNEVFSEYKPNPESEEVQVREYCKVSIGINGTFVRSFDSSLELFRTCFWNTNFRLYMGMYNAFGSAICESYDYYAPINWDE